MEATTPRGPDLPLSRSRRIGVTALLAAIVAAACSGADTGEASRAAARAAPEPAPAGTAAPEPARTIPRGGSDEAIVVTPYVADYVTSSILAGSHDGPSVVQRWERDVTIGVAGSPTPADVAIVTETVAVLDVLIPHHVRRNDRDPDVVVHFAPTEEWAGILDDPDVGTDAGGWAYTFTAGGPGVLSRAVVVVDVALPQSVRHRVVAHELGHAVGLGHGPCPGALMHEGGADASPLWVLTPLDAEVLRILYDERVAAGMSADEVRRLLRPTADDGPGCDDVRWSVIEHGGADHLCALGDGSRPCVRFDGTAPAWPPEQADLWILDGFVAAYDPERFSEYRLDGRRLLCELTSDDLDPCIEWAGPPVPALPWPDPSWYTDGTRAFPRPRS